MLICDSVDAAHARGYQYQAPQGGQIKTAPRLRPAPKALPAWGGTPPTPGLRPPGAPSRTGPPLPRSSSRRGFRARVRRWRGGQPLAVVHARRPALAVFGLLEKFSSVGRAVARRGFGAPPCRAAVGNPAQAVGGQGAAACGCACRPRTGRGCPRATGLQGTPVW